MWLIGNETSACYNIVMELIELMWLIDNETSACYNMVIELIELMRLINYSIMECLFAVMSNDTNLISGSRSSIEELRLRPQGGHLERWDGSLQNRIWKSTIPRWGFGNCQKSHEIRERYRVSDDNYFCVCMVLQCMAMCLYCVAMCLYCIAMCLYCIAMCFNVLQCVLMYCIIMCLYCIAMCFNLLYYNVFVLYCNVF